MKKILIIEDEKDLAKSIGDSLVADGFLVMKAFDGESGIKLFFETKPDLILLDINLPKKDGWKVCKEIRENSAVPIVMMTARDTENDELTGLKIGADDYITKPFSLKILEARIKKILKIEGNNIYRYKNLIFNFKTLEIIIEDEKIELSGREAQLFEYFIRNKGIVLNREKLLNEIWGFDFYCEDRAVDTLIKRLRKKLGQYSENIKTIRGVGYIFNED
ncbi:MULTISPECIES: response regulator transcription factor [unclassified Cetobacterium]|uniref:response regulator transcription factor n=1 Tax=unclassified Cetobacterium TaxID=2630983 RepID=UPI001C8DDD29|nr:response regulator transcription factor [Cetobacterium sp. 2A]